MFQTTRYWIAHLTSLVNIVITMPTNQLLHMILQKWPQLSTNPAQMHRFGGCLAHQVAIDDTSQIHDFIAPGVAPGI